MTTQTIIYTEVDEAPARGGPAVGHVDELEAARRIGSGLEPV